MPGPDAPTEADSKRDGFLSYATEWHSLTIGAGAGLVGGLTYGTEMQAVGLTAMLAVVAVALGLKTATRLRSSVTVEIRKEPWYAIGGVLGLFLLGRLIVLLP
jgi:hypothetical protein